MSNKRIDQFNAAGTITSTNLIAGYQTDSVKYTIQNIRDYMYANLSSVQVVAAAIDTTLTNPISNVLLVTLSKSNPILTLPAMNATNSIPKGERLVIVNFSAETLAVRKSGSASNDYTIAPNYFLALTLTSNSSAGGSFFQEIYYVSDIEGLQTALDAKVSKTLDISYEGISRVLTAADNGKTLIISSSITLTLPQQSTTVLPNGFNVNYAVTADVIVTLATQGADFLEGVTQLRRYDQGTIFIKQIPGGTNYWYLLANKNINDSPVLISTTTTLDPSHCGKMLWFNNASAITITLPTSASSMIGYNFDYTNMGLGTVTFVKQGSDTLNGNTTADRYSAGSFKLLTTTWESIGGTSVIPIQFSIGPFPAAVGTYYVAVSLPEIYTFTGLDINCDSGTATANLKINTTNITGGASIAVSSTPASYALTAANTNSVGQSLLLNISAAASCVNLRAMIRGTVRR